MLQIGPALPSQRPGALRVLYSLLPDAEAGAQMEASLDAERRGEISLDNLLIAQRGTALVGALLYVQQPGRSAFLWPPVIDRHESAPEDVADALLQSAGQRLDGQGVGFTQAILATGDELDRDRLNRNGFPLTVELLFLERSLAGSAKSAQATESAQATRTDENFAPRQTSSARDELEAVPYSTDLRPRLAAVIERTYEGTLDCPSLNGIRSGAESLASHESGGAGGESPLWWLYRWRDEDVGVLLVTSHPDRRAWEISYVGVVPEARGHEFGQAIVSDAIARAAAAGQTAVTLAVDSQNRYAIRIYESLSFIRQTPRLVHLRIHRTSQPAVVDRLSTDM